MCISYIRSPYIKQPDNFVCLPHKQKTLLTYFLKFIYEKGIVLQPFNVGTRKLYQR